MHTPGLDVVGVEPTSRQRPEEASLYVEPLGRSHSGAAVLAGVHTLVDPQPPTIVELVDRRRHTGDDELLEERLLQITERPLDLALAFRVAGLARLDLDTVMPGELKGLRAQQEPSPLGLAEGAHPVGPGDLRDTASRVEEPGDTLEGVLTVDRRREPPQPPA